MNQRSLVLTVGLGLAGILVGAGFFLLTRPKPVAPPGGGQRPTSPDAERVPLPADAGTMSGRVSSVGGALLRHVLVILRQGTEKAVVASTDGDARYSISVPKDGLYDISVGLKGYRRTYAAGTVHLEAGSRVERDLVVRVGPILSGRVIARGGPPLREIKLVLDCRENPDLSENLFVGVAEDGAFRAFADNGGGRTLITAFGLGYAPSAPVERVLDSEEVDDLRFELQVGGLLTGTVVDEEGRPILNAKAYLRSNIVEAGGFSVPTSEDGRFTFGTVPAGEFEVGAHAKGFVREREGRPIVLEPGRDAGPVTITLRRGWSVTGTVVDPSGEPVGKAAVHVNEGNRRYVDATDETGRFEIRGITPDVEQNQKAPGIDKIKARARGFGPVFRGDIAPGADLRLVLGLSSSLEVFLVLDAGDIPPGFRWTVLTRLLKADDQTNEGGEDAWRPSSLSGDSGLVQNLAGGTYEIRISAPGYATVRYPSYHIPAGQKVTLQALLEPGSRSADDLVFDKLKLTPDSLDTFRAQLKVMLEEEEDEEERTFFLEHLRKFRDDLPEGSDLRALWTRALEGF